MSVTVNNSPVNGYIHLDDHDQPRACLHGSGGPQVGEVTRSRGVNKNNPPLHVILQPRNPGVHFIKIIEWSLTSLST